MSVIITGMDMPKSCYSCHFNDSDCFCSITKGHIDRDDYTCDKDCPIKSVEGLTEKLEKEKMLHTGTFEDDNPIDYGLRSGLSKAIKIIKHYCGTEDT